MIERQTTAGLAAGTVGLILATSALGDGGRQADVLVAHQTLAAAATIALLIARPRTTTGRSLAVGLVLVVSTVMYLLSPCRYTTMLSLADVVTAALIYFLATLVTVNANSGRFILLGLLCGVLCNIAFAQYQLLHSQIWGLFANPHHGAALVAASATTLLVVPLSLDRRPLLALRLAIVVAAFTFMAVLSSRGGLLALVAGMCVASVLAGRARFAALGVIAVVIGLQVPSPLSQRLREGARVDRYAFERLRIWRQSGKMGLDHCLRGGVGLGAFPKVARRYNFPVEGGVNRFGKYPNTAHNDYLSLFAETGVFGLLLLILPVVVATRRVYRERGDDAVVEQVRKAALAGAAPILIHGLVDVVLQSPAVLYALFALLGLAAGPPRFCVPNRLSRQRTVVAVLTLTTMWCQGAFVPWWSDRAYRRFVQTRDPAMLGLAIQLTPTHPGYQLEAADGNGRQFLLSGDLADYATAIWHYREASRLDRLDVEVWARRAHFEAAAAAAVFDGQVGLSEKAAIELAENAVDYYAEACARDPFNPFIIRARALVLVRLGRIEEATDSAERAVRLEPNFRGGWELRLQLARLQGDEDTAIMAADELIRIGLLADAVRPTQGYDRALLLSDEVL